MRPRMRLQSKTSFQNLELRFQVRLGLAFGAGTGIGFGNGAEVRIGI